MQSGKQVEEVLVRVVVEYREQIKVAAVRGEVAGYERAVQVQAEKPAGQRRTPRVTKIG